MFENKILNNGKTAIHIDMDDKNNNLFEIPFKSGALKNNCFIAVEVDGILYTTDNGEPKNKILHELQFLGTSRKDVYSDVSNRFIFE